MKSWIKVMAGTVIGAGLGAVVMHFIDIRMYDAKFNTEVERLRKDNRESQENKWKPDILIESPKKDEVRKEESSDEYANVMAKIEEIKTGLPKVISKEEYNHPGEDAYDYDEYSYTFYREDNVVADEMNRQISEAEIVRLLGSDFMDTFDEEGMTYVRNDNEKALIDILLDEGSYYDD